MHSLRDVICHSPGVVPCHAWEIVAQPARTEQNSWVDRGQEQGAREEVERGQGLEVSPRYGVLATNPSVCNNPFGVRALSIPPGGQPLGLIGRDWVYEFWIPLLSAHHDGIHIFLRPPLPFQIPSSKGTTPTFSALEQSWDHYGPEPPALLPPTSLTLRLPPSLLSSLNPDQLLSRTRLHLISSTFSQMRQAVAVCHAVNVFHRDIKPENFIVTDGWVGSPGGRQGPKVVVRLTSFGLSTNDLESADMDCRSAPHMSYGMRS